MKRRVIWGILVMTTLALGACGKQDGSNSVEQSSTATESQVQTESKENDKDDKQDSILSSNVEITMDTLRNHPVSPTSDFEYRSDGEGVQICGYLGDDENVVIPEEVDGKKIISMSYNVFGENSPVRAVRLSDTLESVTGSFFNNTNLQYVICGSSLKVLGENAFAGCSSLEEIELNEGLERMKVNAFSWCENLSSLDIPETTIVNSAAVYSMGEGFTIRSKAGSRAEEVALEWGYNFEAVE